MGDKSHTFLKEQGGVSQFSGLHVCTIPNDEDGMFDLDVLEQSIRAKNDPYKSYTGLIVLESSHNYCGGKVISLKFMEKVRAIADRHGLPVHLDGARALNASVALNVSPAELARNVDSVSFCFSKGVGAPVGTVLIGSRQLIERALRMRKALGGGWRKPGALAAAALVAMRDAEVRIKKDHEHAKMFAQGVMSWR